LYQQTDNDQAFMEIFNKYGINNGKITMRDDSNTGNNSDGPQFDSYERLIDSVIKRGARG